MSDRDVDHLNRLGWTVLDQPAPAVFPLDLVAVGNILGPLANALADDLGTATIEHRAIDPSLSSRWGTAYPCGLGIPVLNSLIFALRSQPPLDAASSIDDVLDQFAIALADAHTISWSYESVEVHRVDEKAVDLALEDARWKVASPVFAQCVTDPDRLFLVTATAGTSRLAVKATTRTASAAAIDIPRLQALCQPCRIETRPEGFLVESLCRVVVACQMFALVAGRLAVPASPRVLQEGSRLALHDIGSWFSFSRLPSGTTNARVTGGAVDVAPSATVALDVREPPVEEYILLPDRGVRVDETRHREDAHLMYRMGGARSTIPPLDVWLPGMPGVAFKVIDSVHEDGPKLVNLRRDAAADIRLRHRGLKLVPIHQYDLAVLPRFALQAPMPGTTQPFAITLVDARTGARIAGTDVIAVIGGGPPFVGVKGVTDAVGRVTLDLLPNGQVQSLYVEAPPSGYWGAYQANVTIGTNHVITLAPLDLGPPDGLRFHHGAGAPGDGTGVKVAVIDTGIGAHPDLIVAGGENTVKGEPKQNFGDNGTGHGTHVAGIIAARGLPPAGVSGLAPGVALFSYRVFGAGGAPATNYSILKAVIRALDNDCDVINLSLGDERGGAARDDALRQGFEAARDGGAVIVAAAGNGGRQAVTTLANYANQEGFSVSALGRRGTFPAGALEDSDIAPQPAGTHPDDFIAAFSNFGLISLTAAGVGIISTVPGGGYRPRSGTSMAAPVVSGITARIIGQNLATLPVNRDAQRAAAVMTLVQNGAQSLGFGAPYEGSGMPR